MNEFRLILASASPRRKDILENHGISPVVMPSDWEETIPPEMECAPPEEICTYLAYHKAKSVYEMIRKVGGTPAASPSAAAPPTTLSPIGLRTFVLGADTIVVCGKSVGKPRNESGLYEDILDKSRTESGLCGKSAGKPSDESDLCCEILGKPTDEADARRMLRLLRGRPHRVMTGVSLWELPAGRNLTAYDISTVYFRDYPDETIEEYLRVEQPYDKAGSYAIQSFATGKYHPLAEKIDGDLENVIGLPMHLVRRMLDAMLQP